MQLEAIEAQVLSLPLEARSHLLDRLIASLDEDTEWEKAWLAEALRRDADIESGKAIVVDGAEVFQRLRAKYS